MTRRSADGWLGDYRSRSRDRQWRNSNGYGLEPRSRELGSRHASAHGSGPFLGPSAPSLRIGLLIVFVVIFACAGLWAAIYLRPWLMLSIAVATLISLVVTTIIRRLAR